MATLRVQINLKVLIDMAYPLTIYSFGFNKEFGSKFPESY